MIAKEAVSKKRIRMNLETKKGLAKCYRYTSAKSTLWEGEIHIELRNMGTDINRVNKVSNQQILTTVKENRTHLNTMMNIRETG